MNWYNENDPQKAAWLRELIRENVIASGEVDERSIVDVEPADLRGYTQCHFFAGIGVWSYALRLAGWPDDRPVWTGSCPCPSFSATGKGKGFADPRHLWPAWYRLIPERRIPAIFGEQSDEAIEYGWLDLVQTDLERKGYSVGKAVLRTCSVGGATKRPRLYFVARANRNGLQPQAALPDAHAECDIEPCGSLVRADRAGLQRHRGDGPEGSESGWFTARSSGPTPETSILNGFWRGADWVLRQRWNRQGFDWSPVEPGTFPLAHGAANRVLKLRGYGDAIVPQVAAVFIQAAWEAIEKPAD